MYTFCEISDEKWLNMLINVIFHLEKVKNSNEIFCFNLFVERGLAGERTVKKLRLSKALTVPESTTIYEACRRMAARKVDALLLTDSNALLCGILTDKVWLKSLQTITNFLYFNRKTSGDNYMN